MGTGLCVSHDGKYLFTAGGRDCAVHMWQINADVLSAQVELQGTSMPAFFDMMEGGADGELMNELREYFYYVQLRRQGLSSMASREVSDRIPIEDVPDLLRAMGFFPTESQVQDILNELKFGPFAATREFGTHADVEDVVRLYLNHRPALGLAPEDLRAAFADICKVEDEPSGSLATSELLRILQEQGDALTEDELARTLANLLGEA